jgi:hypothetical protein
MGLESVRRTTAGLSTAGQTEEKTLGRQQLFPKSGVTRAEEQKCIRRADFPAAG